MATVASTFAQDTGSDDGSVGVFSWTPLTTTNADGAPVRSAQYADRCVQVTGTFGAAGSISIQGSNDGTNWAILNNAKGAAATWTAAGFGQIVEIPLYMRPFVSAGDGTTSLTVQMLCRRTNPMRT